MFEKIATKSGSLSLAAGPLPLPLLWGIDKAYCGKTQCSNPNVFKIYVHLRQFDLIIQDDALFRDFPLEIQPLDNFVCPIEFRRNEFTSIRPKQIRKFW